MDNIHTLDPRKQELLEARFITNRVSYWFTAILYWDIFCFFMFLNEFRSVNFVHGVTNLDIITGTPIYVIYCLTCLL